MQSFVRGMIGPAMSQCLTQTRHVDLGCAEGEVCATGDDVLVRSGETLAVTEDTVTSAGGSVANITEVVPACDTGLTFTVSVQSGGATSRVAALHRRCAARW